MKSLVEQAKLIPVMRKLKNFPHQELELVVAWLTGEISAAQVARVIKKAPTGIASWVLPRVREAYTMGLIKKGEK